MMEKTFLLVKEIGKKRMYICEQTGQYHQITVWPDSITGPIASDGTTPTSGAASDAGIRFCCPRGVSKSTAYKIMAGWAREHGAAVALGRKGRAVNSPAQKAAARENGKRGGRPLSLAEKTRRAVREYGEITITNPAAYFAHVDADGCVTIWPHRSPAVRCIPLCYQHSNGRLNIDACIDASTSIDE